ncbi:MAG: type II toxin-antitoxin system RelE/ParE family toxin [Verrucomicrobia bacterium]|nr:type II toxin-antitoxin system RelE/ParE family toxin [Verrucomicrobiota bacterium]
MSEALQVFYASFDAAFFKLPPELQARIEMKIDDMGRRLAQFPHQRLKGGERCKLRVGDYRVIYRVNTAEKTIHLLAVGHRREVYRR